MDTSHAYAHSQVCIMSNNNGYDRRDVFAITGNVNVGQYHDNNTTISLNLAPMYVRANIHTYVNSLYLL